MPQCLFDFDQKYDVLFERSNVLFMKEIVHCLTILVPSIIIIVNTTNVSELYGLRAVWSETRVIDVRSA